MYSYLFTIITLIGFFLAFIIFFSENTMYSIVSMIALFVFSAVILIIIYADFLAFIYIIVYVGAVAILFLFVLMLLDLRTEDFLSLNLINIFNFSKEFSLLCILKFFSLLWYMLNITEYLFFHLINLNYENIYFNILYFIHFKLYNIYVFSYLVYTEYAYILIFLSWFLLIIMVATISLVLFDKYFWYES